MQKYVVMVRPGAAVIVNAADNKTVKEYINNGYGIMNRIKCREPLENAVEYGGFIEFCGYPERLGFACKPAEGRA